MEYNNELGELTTILSSVDRPGNFYTSDSLDVPLPNVQIEGIGTLSFPLPDEQAKKITRKAKRAPYGRGEETIVDTRVRNVWQVPPQKVKLGGKSWSTTMDKIVHRVAHGFGCDPSKVSTELYKLLLYDKGSFFTAHRDTEKTDGMFATLVVVLPSFHQGGELVIRHGEREVSLDLAPQETSEITFAAFYADCQHEVRPITQGNRICLVYNLIQKAGPGKKKKAKQALTAPDYSSEIAKATEMLRKWQETRASPKLAYLLEHQYSPGGLSFSGLKNKDAAVASVLSKAADQADCVIHLGIVHIEESGPAEPDYEMLPRRSRRFFWDDDLDDLEDDAEIDVDYEIVEISEWEHYINEWVDPNDQSVDFGKIPLKAGELLPAGCLDNEEPDKQRVTEATGNEGASFERSYHRAAIVVWSREQFPEVLLQAGAKHVVPHLRQRMQAWSRSRNSSDQSKLRQEIISLAKRTIDEWEPKKPFPLFPFDAEETKQDAGYRAEMLELLMRLKEPSLIGEFIENVVGVEYDGQENAALAECCKHLRQDRMSELLSGIAAAHMNRLPDACVDLLSRIVGKLRSAGTKRLRRPTQNIAESVIEGLSNIGARDDMDWMPRWGKTEESPLVKPSTVVTLFDTLRLLEAPELSATAVKKIAANPATFPPDTVLVEALSILNKKNGRKRADPEILSKLWQHCVELLLERSEQPPQRPKDWAQPIDLDCSCADCQELEKFAADPDAQIGRFPIRKGRRQHLHQTIEHYRLDMTHETERKGSPHTLVCKKTLRAYERRCEQYRQDIQSMKRLQKLAPNGSTFQELSRRITNAVNRQTK